MRGSKSFYGSVSLFNSQTSAFINRRVTRTVANQDKTLLPTAASQNELPLPLKGYLNKYTNMAKGYGTRWFVLKDGVLSCEFPSCWVHETLQLGM